MQEVQSCRDSQKYAVYMPVVAHTITLPPCSCVRCPHAHQNQIPAVHNMLFNTLTANTNKCSFAFHTVSAIKSVHVSHISDKCPGTTSIVTALLQVSMSLLLRQGGGY